MMQKSGKVVVVSQHYPPDPSTTAAIMAAIAERVTREAEVLVLSGTAGSAAAAAAGKLQVIEVGSWMPGKAALLKRALAELLFTIRMFAALLVQLRRERGLSSSGGYSIGLESLNRLVMQSGLTIGSPSSC